MVNKIGIMGAMPDEVEQIMCGLDEKKIEEYAGVEFHIGTRAGRKLFVCCAGMGKANTAATAQVLITKYEIDAILFSGIAGNMSNRIGIGDVVIGKELLYHDAELELLEQSAPYTSLYQSDPFLIDAVEQGCQLVGVRYLVGRIATGDQYVGDYEVKRRIQKLYHPDCVEMEGAAVGQIAMRNNIPFVVIRAMSDNSDLTLEYARSKEFDHSEYVKTASSIVIATIDTIRDFEK